MADIFDERRRALEDEYFRRKDKEALEHLREHIRDEARKNSGTPTMDCPRCPGKLHAENYNDVQIDRCDNCGGVWIDAGELVEILSQESTTSRWLHALWPGRTND